MRELTNITHVKCSEQYSKHIIDINHYHREHTVLQICTNIFSPPSHQTHSSSLFQKDPLGLLIGIHLAGLIKPSLQNFDNIYITSFQMSYLYTYVYYTHMCVCVCVCGCVCARTLSHAVVSNSLRSHGSSVPGILQARILESIAMSSSRGLSQPGDRTLVTYVSCFGRQILYH